MEADGHQMDGVAAALEGLCTDAEMQKKYGLSGAVPLFLPLGDGNHSLATAKQCYESEEGYTREPGGGLCRPATRWWR